MNVDSGEQSEIESGPSSCAGPPSPPSSHASFLPSLYRYVTELDRLRHRIFDEEGSPWLATMTVKESRAFR